MHIQFLNKKSEPIYLGTFKDLIDRINNILIYLSKFMVLINTFINLRL